MSDDQTTEKDDCAVLSKRKKHLDNMRSGQSKLSKKPKVSWTQSNEDVTMSLRLEGMRNDQLKNLDVQFSDTDVSINLSDGRNWLWNFNKEIFREKSKVKIKKGTLTLHMKKKQPLSWEQLEIPAAENAMEDGQEKPTEDTVVSEQMPESGHGEEVKVTGDENEGPCVTTPTLDEEVKIPEDECTNQETEVFEKEEGKRGLFPAGGAGNVRVSLGKENTFVVHIYVKGVSKDNLIVVFEPKTFRVKFQTSHEQFLKLHKDATCDTKFRWQVNLREEVISERCSYKVTSSFIELSLCKKEALRWGDLEALKCRETPVAKSETWIPLGNVKTSSETETVDRQVMFDEMKQSIERQNLSEKAADSGPNPSPSTETAQPKPMCKVQPLSKQPEVKEQVVTPGYTGLDNLGNTCFMNGVLQCLGNTREFRDFFLNGEFQKDLNIENVLGSGGKLAVCFAVLMRVLWSGKYVSYPPSKLKSLVAQKASQFTGFAQHDSQEFLAFLLDGLHEDLNRIKKKPYTETVEDRGRPDEVVANEAWEVHKKRNDSFVVDLFQGQYKSKLVCPVCGKVSITFDPFLYLSLPLPKRQRLLPVTFMWKDPYKKPIRYMLRLSKEATVEQLKDALQKKTGVHPENIRVIEAYRGRIHKIFKRGSSLINVQANDCIIGCEVYSKEMAGEPVYEVAVVQRTLMPNQFPSRCHNCKKLCPAGSKLKRCTKCYKVGYCDQTCQKQNWHVHKTQCKLTPDPVGTPFIISVPESRATFARLCQLMEAYARYSVDVFQPPVKVELPSKLSSQPSSSSLSNSSQSSGSLNSLDSQSSFSSSCTITAEQEENIEDMDIPPEIKVDEDVAIATSRPNNDIVSDGNEQFVGGDSYVVKPECESKSVSESDMVSVDSGYKTVTDGMNSCGSGDNTQTLDGTQEKEFVSPVKPVIGIQSGDAERTTPMFYLKPVNSEGTGLLGPDGERLDDNGDIPLDLTCKPYLSVDWKNNDKLSGYVLVQSKEMDFDNDSSMMTATLEESNNVTLEQCLELFTEPEVLAPEEAWYCPQCKEHREATKQLSSWKLPHTLIIQLKRFSFRNFIWRDKIDKMVEFPTRGLDLSHYYVGNRPTNEPPPVYDLYGVVNHHGGILGGHYTSFVRCVDKDNTLKNDVGWRLCDDSRVSSISHEKNVVTRAAYLLFYRRRETFTPPSIESSLETVKTLDREKDVISEQEPASREELSEIDEEDSNKTELEMLGTGNLVIDTSDKASELADFDTSHDEGEEPNEVGGVPYIILEDDAELGYTDMDSVD